MIPTVDFIKLKYQEFNHLCFNDELPTIPVRLSNARTFLGQLACKKRRSFWGTIECYDFVLKVSTRVDLPEREVEDTIIHEMIHFYIHVKKLKDTSTHGPVFREIMNTINSEYGRNITVSYKYTVQQREEAADKRPKWHIIAIAKFEDGKTGVKVLPRYERSVLIFNRKVFLIQGVKEVEFYLSNDPFFNKFPVSSAIRLHIVNNDELKPHLPSIQHKINLK